MRLRDFLKRDMLLLDVVSSKKEDVIGELVNVFPIGDRAKEILIDTLLNREKLGSTGVGKGIAIPHCRSLVVEKPLISVGRSRKGVDFGSLDDKPVHIVFLVCAPPQPRPMEYLLILGKVAQLCKEIVKSSRVFETDDAEEFMSILVECDERVEKRRG
jgi:mannitol/fructose-specific phosphotransferase system IIA component (Ntr-type)